jgi:ATP-dependent Lon protease
MFFKSEGADRPAEGKVGTPLLPLRDIIVFPHMVSQLFVGRERSIAALDAAMERGKELFLSAQRSAKTNEPTPDDVFTVGTVGTILQLLRLPDGTVKVLVEGKRRAKARKFVQAEPFFLVELDDLPDAVVSEARGASGVELEALMRGAQSAFDGYAKLNKKVQPEVLAGIQSIDEPGRLADTIAANLQSIKLADRQGLLEMLDVRQRLERLVELMQAEVEILQVERKIRSRVKKQMERTQKEYYLNEQMHAIQKELGGERDEFKSELGEIEAAVAKKALSAEAQARVKKELRKLKMMHPTSAEATVVRNYIDWIVDLPWGEKTEQRFDLVAAEQILDEDHYGLDKIKERILEYLAVQALTGTLRSPVLCFVGPPGVGKTSLARSIARATGRKFVRLSLGGVRDEAEIRGHRRTYIGALPGKLIQSLKKAGTSNPVFLLDEVDKMSSDFRGDPSAALLEALDPEQNATFNDHYLDLDYDLSDVMFITTANSLSGIPLPLQDRMEIIELSGYTEYEKLHIASRYLVPRQKKECGLADAPVTFTEGALRTLVHHYTRESGVRSLEREIGSVCRKVARAVLGQKRASEERAAEHEGAATAPAIEPVEVTAKLVPKYLGVPKHRLGRTERSDEIGLVNGLAVTSVGGDLLPAEAVVMPGKGKLVITGLLEKGMEESAQAAMSFVRSRLERLGLDPAEQQKVDVHVHFPDFVKKDGPSAGVTMVTAILSALLKVPVRHDLAMTGEITLRGRVMPIGGVKEKLLAAHRGGVRTVLVPAENRKDLRDVPRRVLRALRVVLVDHADQVLREALVLPEADKLLGPAAALVEYRFGELIEPGQGAQGAAQGTPSDATSEAGRVDA